jgi:hypothetical protein
MIYNSPTVAQLPKQTSDLCSTNRIVSKVILDEAERRHTTLFSARRKLTNLLQVSSLHFSLKKSKFEDVANINPSRSHPLPRQASCPLNYLNTNNILVFDCE